MFSPAALGSFADREGRGIDDAILEPAQKSPFAHREQAGNGGIGESIASGEISRHRSLGDSTTYTGDLATILVTKMFSWCGLDSSLRWWVLATAGVRAVIVGISPNPQWAADPQTQFIRELLRDNQKRGTSTKSLGLDLALGSVIRN